MEDWWHSKQKLLQTKDWEVDPSKREAAFEAECEKVFMQTYSFLNKVQDHLAPVSAAGLCLHSVDAQGQQHKYRLLESAALTAGAFSPGHSGIGPSLKPFLCTGELGMCLTGYLHSIKLFLDSA